MGPIAGDKAGEGGALLLLGRPARFVVACGRRRGHKAFSAADNEQPLDVSLRGAEVEDDGGATARYFAGLCDAGAHAHDLAGLGQLYGPGAVRHGEADMMGQHGVIAQQHGGSCGNAAHLIGGAFPLHEGVHATHLLGLLGRCGRVVARDGRVGGSVLGCHGYLR